MKIYISGPMTGIKNYNYPAFNQTAETLRANGHTVYNPAEIKPPPNDYRLVTKREIWIYYMKKAIILLMKAETVVLLPGWQKSKGAKIERWIGKILGYRIMELSEIEVVL